MNSLSELLNKFCLEGKARFYLSEFVEEGNVSIEEAEKFLIPLMGTGKIEGSLELRCPNCGKDLGAFRRLPEIPENSTCPICAHEFGRSFDYIEIVLEVKGDFFRPEGSCTSPNSRDSYKRRTKTIAE